MWTHARSRRLLLCALVALAMLLLWPAVASSETLSFQPIADPLSLLAVQQAELTGSDGAAADVFGRSVALSGDTALVGAPGGNSSAGAVYVFERSGVTWTQRAELTASDGTINDRFGYSVALSGDTALVGAPGGDSSAGAAYVFERSGVTWTQRAELTSTDAGYDGRFGYSVALSGDTALVGAPIPTVPQPTIDAILSDAHDGTIDGDWTAPAVSATLQYLHEDPSFERPLYGDYYGVLVDYVAYYESWNAGGPAGTAYVFERSGAAWTQQAELTVSAGEDADFFGSSVALSGDTALIGAWGKTDAGQGCAGAAYVFERSGVTWTQQAALTAAGAVWDHEFGSSVALCGDIALVGAHYGPSWAGAAYVFERSGVAWTQRAELTASDGTINDRFGYSVALSGDTALVGAPGGNSAAGAAYVFERSGVTWTQRAEPTATDAGYDDRFGASVALSGDTALVGASGGNSSAGVAYVYLLLPGILTTVDISGVTWHDLDADGARDKDANGNYTEPGLQNWQVRAAGSALQVTSPEPVADLHPDVLTGSPDGLASGQLVSCGLGGSAAAFPGGVAGNIALIQRGTYTFEEKVENATAAGAAGVVIYNNTAGSFSGTLQGTGTIPAVAISAAEGATLQSLLASGPVSVSLLVASQSAVTDATGAYSLALRPGIRWTITEVGELQPDGSYAWGDWRISSPLGAAYTVTPVSGAAGQTFDPAAQAPDFGYYKDAQPPHTTATPAPALPANGWFKGPVTVQLTAGDVGSGVASIDYQIVQLASSGTTGAGVAHQGARGGRHCHRQLRWRRPLHPLLQSYRQGVQHRGRAPVGHRHRLDGARHRPRLAGRGRCL